MTTQLTTDQPRRSALGAFKSAAANLIERLASTSFAASCAREVERLSLLSDAELARRGLTRDRIVQHAFRRYMNS